MPVYTAKWLVGWAERIRAGHSEETVGVNPDRDRDQMDRALKSWLSAWKRNLEHPKNGYEAALAEQQPKSEEQKLLEERAEAECAQKVGASQHDAKPAKKKKKKRGKSAPANLGADVVPATLNRDHQREMPEVGVSTEWLDRMAAEAVV